VARPVRPRAGLAACCCRLAASRRLMWDRHHVGRRASHARRRGFCTRYPRTRPHLTAKRLGTAKTFGRGRDSDGDLRGVAKCVTGTARAGRDRTARVSPWAWDGVRQGRGLAPSGTCVGVLITRRSQVQILPPLPTCQRYNRRSTARKLSLRAVFVCGGGVRSDQIADQIRLGCPAASHFDEMHRDA